MRSVDNPSEMASLDAGRMLHFLHELPEVAEAAFERGAAAPLPLTTPDRLLICGMGGSAISGDLLRTHLLASCALPVMVHRGDRLPGYADARTLLVVMTYSGNTGETLACLREAIRRGVPTVVVTNGGTAGELADAHGLPRVDLPGGWQPRAALGDLFFALLGVASQLSACEAVDVAGIASSLRALRDRCGTEVASAANPAKQLAVALEHAIPVVVGATGTTEAVAVRWKCQLNENAKRTALALTLPEMTHNDIVNLTASNHDGYAVVAFEDAEDSAFVKAQRGITLEILKDTVGAVHVLPTEGATLLERQLTSIYLGDWVSVYLAFLQGLDPTPVDAIGRLKTRMKDVTEVKA